MKGGKLDPVAVVKGGKSIAFADFMKAADAGTPPAGGGEAKKTEEAKK
jgi:hypothetical protein